MPIPDHRRRYNERSASVTVEERKRRAVNPLGPASFRETVKLLKVSQMRRAIYNVIKPGATHADVSSRIYDILIITVAFLSLVPLIFKDATPALRALDHATVYILFFDYILRWVTADLREGRMGKKPFFRYPLRPLALLTLIGMLPSLGVFPTALGFIRVARIATIFYYTDDLFFVGSIIRNERRALISAIGLILGYMFIGATVLYAVEADTFANFVDALYWSVTTFTTTGYGDLFPHEYAGKVVTMIAMFAGILIMAVPTGVITAGYMYELRKRREQGSYYMRNISVRESYARFKESGGIKGFLDNHKPLTRYLLMMLFCLAVDVILMTIARISALPLWLDTFGAALASSLLETAAGIIVGLGANIYLAILAGDPGQLLFYLVPAMTAIMYGAAFQRGKEITFRKTVRVVAAIVVIGTVWDIALAYLLYDGVPSGVGESMLYYILDAYGVPSIIAKVAAVFSIELIDKVLTALLVVLFYIVTPNSWRHIALPPVFNHGADLFREGRRLR